MEISDIAFVNFTGYTLAKSNKTAIISCSNAHPCFNIALQNVTLALSKNASAVEAFGTCQNTAGNGVSGMLGSGC